jgi:cytidylate kinase
LIPAKDAIVIATDGKKKELVVQEILEHVQRYIQSI